MPAIAASASAYPSLILNCLNPLILTCILSFYLICRHVCLRRQQSYRIAFYFVPVLIMITIFIILLAIFLKVRVLLMLSLPLRLSCTLAHFTVLTEICAITCSARSCYIIGMLNAQCL